MTENFIYEMPGLSKFRFSIKGGCKNIETNNVLIPVKQHRRNPYYYIEGNDGKRHVVGTMEIMQYTKHLEAIKEPILFGYYVVYRPIIRRNRMATKFTDRKPIADL